MIRCDGNSALSDNVFHAGRRLWLLNAGWGTGAFLSVSMRLIAAVGAGAQSFHGVPRNSMILAPPRHGSGSSYVWHHGLRAGVSGVAMNTSIMGRSLAGQYRTRSLPGHYRHSQFLVKRSRNGIVAGFPSSEWFTHCFAPVGSRVSRLCVRYASE
jgi:hypothetical protein